MKINQFIIALIVGAIIAFIFFKGCQNNAKLEPPIIAPVQKIVKNVEQKESLTNIKVDSIQKVLNDAKKQIAWLNLNDKAADDNISLLRNRIAVLQSIVSNKLTDTIGNVNNDFEDSKEQLYSEINNLNKANDYRDSICDTKVELLTITNNVRDSVIYLKNKLYSSLRLSFDTLVDNNIKLIDFVKYQKKEITKRKIGSFFWKSAAATLSGILIYKSIK